MTVSLGNIIYSAVKPIFKIYFIMGVGFYLAKKNILNVSTCRDISDAIVTAIMPCLIFYNIVTNLKSTDIKYLGIISFTGTLLFLVGCILAYAISIITKSPKRWLGGLLSVGLFPNISDLPIAYMQTLSSSGGIFTSEQGSLGVAYVCIFLATQIFYQFSLGLYQLVEWDFRDELVANDEEQEDLTVDASEDNETASSEKENEATQDKDMYFTIPTLSLTQGTIQQQDEEDNDNTSIESETSEEVIGDRPKPLQNVLDFERQQHNAFLKQRSLQKISSNRSMASSSSHFSHILNPIKDNALSLQLTSEARNEKAQSMNDVINEYSQFEELKQIRSQNAAASIASGEHSASLSPYSVENTETAANDSSIKDTASVITKRSKVKSKLIQILKNFLSPNSLSLIFSIAISMAPPLKALFVHSKFKIPDAPDGNPPLSFIMDFTAYVGQASVPLGLLLLGATISRLQVKRMPQGFWKTAAAITLARLVILPIVGVGLTTGFDKAGWYGDDALVRFISVLEFGLPNATALVYFTAFYTNPNSEDHLQMDCLAICLIFQYACLWFTLPILVSYTLKVSLHI